MDPSFWRFTPSYPPPLDVEKPRNHGSAELQCFTRLFRGHHFFSFKFLVFIGPTIKIQTGNLVWKAHHGWEVKYQQLILNRFWDIFKKIQIVGSRFLDRLNNLSRLNSSEGPNFLLRLSPAAWFFMDHKTIGKNFWLLISHSAKRGFCSSPTFSIFLIFMGLTSMTWTVHILLKTKQG